MTISTKTMSRRRFVGSSVMMGTMALAGCASGSRFIPESSAVPKSRKLALLYKSIPDEKFPIPAVDLDKVPSKYLRRQVKYNTKEKPGTVIVDTKHFYLYLVERDGFAMRYGVGLGRAGFEWSGRANSLEAEMA